MSRHQEPGGHQGRKGTSHGQDGTSNLDKSKPINTEETIVATQLDEIVEVEKESGGSPSRTAAMRGGIHQSYARWGGAGYQANMHDMTLSSVLS